VGNPEQAVANPGGAWNWGSIASSYRDIRIWKRAIASRRCCFRCRL
jgi:hypothetical protein